MRSLRLTLAVLLVSTFAPVLARGQAVGTGVIQGRVTDPSGAVVVGASVILTTVSTHAVQTTETNNVGLYVFANVPPGTYTVAVSKSGFKKATTAEQTLITSQSLNLDVTLQVGAATQTVEVTATPGAQLQTINSTMGTSLSGNLLLQVPTMDRDVTSVLYYQPAVAPNNSGAEGNYSSESVNGQQSDQNTFMIDGGNATSTFDGDNAYVNGGRSPIPTNIESTEEVKVNTNNQTADFSASTGGQVLVATKHGTDAWHGSAYDYLQNSSLDSNNWGNNVRGTPKQESKYNRFGFDLGGPMLPHMLGGRTYFYFNYEALRYPRSAISERSTPFSYFVNGIVQIREGADQKPVSWNVANFDPRGLGVDPAIAAMWNKYMPAPNDVNPDGTCRGGGLNTCGIRGSVSVPINNNLVVGRVDHDFGQKNRWFGSYRWYDQVTPSTNNVDIGGLLPGDKKGVPATASSNTNYPRYFVTGLTSSISPTLTNNLNLSYLRSQWQWLRNGFVPSVAGVAANVEVGGESYNALVPVNLDTQDSRARLWDEHDTDLADTISWVKGNHFFQFGGDYTHYWWHFDRYDDVVSGLTHLVYQVTNGNVLYVPPADQPPPCPSNTSGTNCVPPDSLGGWNGAMAELLGIVDQANVVATRSGNNLALNPLGQPIHQYIHDWYGSLYMSDTYHIRPNLTFSYGLNYAYEPPPTDIHGFQDILSTAAGTPLPYETYLNNRYNAAVQGLTYAPTIGYQPVGLITGQHLFQPYYGMIQPRVALAWSPKFDNGVLGAVFGDNKSVFRGGWSRQFDRSQAVNLASNAVLGDGFLQPAGCSGPDTTSSTSRDCLGQGNVTPTNAFRLGTDGNVVPIALAPTLPTPVEPGVNAPYISGLAGTQDYLFRPGVEDSIDFSIQRQLKGNMILEVGYIGNWSKHLSQGIDLSDVPWMMKLSNQTWAQAYDNLYNQLHVQGTPYSSVSAQPFIETGLAGSPYLSDTNAAIAAFNTKNAGTTGFVPIPACADYSCAVAYNESGNIGGNNMYNVWSDLDNSWYFGPQLLSSTQCYWCYGATSLGFSNYQAMTVSLQKRTGHGLTLSTNMTYGHSLGTYGLNQEYTLANQDNPWNLYTDYGPQAWDHKFIFNWLGTYELPFGKGQRFATNNPILDRIIGGWTIAPIVYYNSGFPANTFDGSCQAFGDGNDGNCPAAVAMVNTRNLGTGSAHNFTGDTTTGVGLGSGSLTGKNEFSDPVAAYNGFTNCLVGVCGRGFPEGGLLRGQPHWNLDFSLNKTTNITERVKIEFFSEWFNALNHMQWSDAGWNQVGDAYDFGAIYGQYGALGEYTRVIQLGARVSF